jgi:hypothetical protein
VYFECTNCEDYQLCFKCYKAKDTVHPNHDFQDRGFDHDSDEEDSDGEVAPEPRDDPALPGPASRANDDEHDDGFDDEVVSDGDD